MISANASAPVSDIIDVKLQRGGADVFRRKGEEWMDQPNPGPLPMRVRDILPQGLAGTYCARGATGKTTNACHLLGMQAWPMPGDTWMGRKLDDEGCKVALVTREESPDSMVRMAYELGWHERRAAYQARTGDMEKRFHLEHQMSSRMLVEGDGRRASRTEYMKYFTDFAMEWQPGITVFDTTSKLVGIDLNGRTETSMASDVFSDYAVLSGSATLLTHHGNKQKKIESLDDFRGEISGSAGFVDGFRFNLGHWQAHRELADVVVACGLAENHYDVFCFGLAKGNIKELIKPMGIRPLLVVRGRGILDGYKDVTAQARSLEPRIDELLEGRKVPKNELRCFQERVRPEAIAEVEELKEQEGEERHAARLAALIPARAPAKGWTEKVIEKPIAKPKKTTRSGAKRGRPPGAKNRPKDPTPVPECAKLPQDHPDYCPF